MDGSVFRHYFSQLPHILYGLFIPAHVDRTVFSVRSQLGFLPAGRYDAVEVIHDPPRIETGAAPLIYTSDAHTPEHIGRRYITFDADQPGFRGLAAALSENRQHRVTTARPRQ